ncbi:glycosyltransferase family 4 protein [Rhodalgimonas zhirmunskyi]|uniref:Glycosyltransferase family 4 protein n=1 Tax=Rhodalgimonas zhirmunskyi TaxID=2964767 RepID=A0AAJ1X3C0_9RHOB|nr:glycosyltransferase family 4 protein [Rhodoalgimonas zhirmunskyi]MDQ2093158.1 glycosyltransferase family 4 protein [Rhodoalgimonas zhirmunskyi]
MSLRIAYLTGEYPRATDTFIQREVTALRAHGVEVETCSIRRTGAEHHVGPEQQREAANTFHVLEAAKRPATLLKAHARALTRHPARYLRALRLAWKTSPGGIRATLYQLIYFAEAAVLAQRLQDTGAKHLHNHIAKSSCTVAMLASELSGIPYSFTLHGPDIFFEPIHWRLDEKIKRATFVACISEFCRSQAMAFSPPEHWQKLHIIHCGVDPARYDYPTERAKREKPQLLFVGRIAAVKGLPILLDALPQITTGPLALAVIGDGPDRALIEAQARTLPPEITVDFMGYRSQSDVAAMLGEVDMLVLPSFAEGVPVVLMEAMAARLPVVTTRIAGIPELITDGTHGHLVPPGDTTALAHAIADLIDYPDKAAEMGRRGREKVQAEFDSHAEAARLAHLFHAYAQGKTPPKRPANHPEAQP